MRVCDRDLIRGEHYGQRSCEPHSKAEHMAVPTKPADVKILLANSEPSTHGPKPTCKGARGCFVSAYSSPYTTRTYCWPAGISFSDEMYFTFVIGRPLHLSAYPRGDGLFVLENKCGGL